MVVPETDMEIPEMWFSSLHKKIKVSEIDNKTALTFDNQLIIFKRLEESLKDIDLTMLTDKQKDNLRLLSNDSMMTEDRNETAFITVKTANDLEIYDVKRAEMYDDYM